MRNVTGLAEQKKYGNNVIDFKNKEKQKKIKLEDSVCTKLSKNGTFKNVKNNSKPNRDNIQPFREEDIPILKRYFIDKINNSKNTTHKLINRRNYAIFVMGINIGLRASDLTALKWNDIFDDEWNFLEGKKITPKKTSKKNKKVILKYNESFRNAILEYKEYYGNVRNIDSCIFKSREDGHNHIGVDRISTIIKDAVKSTGVKGTYASHSLRKTFARARYNHSSQKDKTLVELMKLFNHASTSVTLAYIGIAENELEDLYNEVNL